MHQSLRHLYVLSSVWAEIQKRLILHFPQCNSIDFLSNAATQVCNSGFLLKIEGVNLVQSKITLMTS